MAESSETESTVMATMATTEKAAARVGAGEETMAHGTETLYLRPDELTVDEAFNMRPFSTAVEGASDPAVEKLADRIEALGQLDPVKVIARAGKARNGEEPKESYVIIAGHRRRRAIALINQRRTAKSNGTASLLKVWCVVDRGAADPKQKAFSSNFDRKNMSPMDIAMLIEKLRKEHGADLGGTGKIARHLGLDKASVLQYEKLLGKDVPQDTRKRLHAGLVSMDSVLTLIREKVPGEKHAAILDDAKRIQDAEKLEKIAESKGSVESKQKKAVRAMEKKRVEAPAVKKAIRKHAPEAKVKPGLRELKELVEGLDGPAYGHQDAAVRVWARYVVDEYLAGTGTEKGFMSRFDRMVVKADRGTAVERKAAAAGGKDQKNLPAKAARGQGGRGDGHRTPAERTTGRKTPKKKK